MAAANTPVNKETDASQERLEQTNKSLARIVNALKTEMTPMLAKLDEMMAINEDRHNNIMQLLAYLQSQLLTTRNVGVPAAKPAKAASSKRKEASASNAADDKAEDKAEDPIAADDKEEVAAADDKEEAAASTAAAAAAADEKEEAAATVAAAVEEQPAPPPKKRAGRKPKAAESAEVTSASATAGNDKEAAEDKEESDAPKSKRKTAEAAKPKKKVVARDLIVEPTTAATYIRYAIVNDLNNFRTKYSALIAPIKDEPEVQGIEDEAQRWDHIAGLLWKQLSTPKREPVKAAYDQWRTDQAKIGAPAPLEIE